SGRGLRQYRHDGETLSGLPAEGNRARAPSRRAGRAKDGGVLRTVEDARPHFGAAKTPRDERTMATSRIVASVVDLKFLRICTDLTKEFQIQNPTRAIGLLVPL